jgi:hypothetical protein
VSHADYDIPGRIADAVRRIEALVQSGELTAAVRAISPLHDLDRLAYEFGNDGGLVAANALEVIEILLGVLEDAAKRQRH